MEIYRAYKFRIYPNQIQQKFLDNSFGCCRFLWNQMLNERITVYNELKHDKRKLFSYKYKTEKRYKSEFKFLKKVDSKALQTSTRNLLIAFKNFYHGLKKKQKVGFPKFKSSKHKQSYSTYNINNNIKIDFSQKLIKFPKIKTWMKFQDDRVFSEPILRITVSKTKTCKYYVSILIEKEIEVSPKQEIDVSKIEAFDMSLSDFLVSPVHHLQNPRFYRKEEKKLRKLHRELSRKKKGSLNRKKARLRLARLYEKITNRKLDWCHKLSTDLANRYECIILEDLNIKGMQQFNSGFSKSVTRDFSWNQFVNQLHYKLVERGHHLIVVDRWFPSSKLCSQCGWKHNNLKLYERTWKCQVCGSFHQRDRNASINLLKEGTEILKKQELTLISTVGTTGSYAWGDHVRLSSESNGH